DTQFVVDWGGVGTGTIKVVVTDRFGCRDSSFISVIKNHSLAKPKVFGDTNLCALTTNEPYWVKGVQKENYTWQVVGGAFAGGNPGSAIKVNWGVAAAASIGVQASAYDSVSKLPCLSPWSTVKVILQPAPNAPPVITINQCQTRSWISYWKPQAAVAGEKIYPQISAAGLSFKLTPAADSSSWDIQFYGDTFGIFTVQYRLTSQWFCPGPFTSATVTLKPRPKTSGISGPSDVCFPNLNNIGYQVSGETGSTMEWWLSQGGFTNPPMITDKQINVTWSLTATPGIVRAVETSSDGCIGDTQQLQVFVDNPSIVLNFITVSPPPNSDNSVWLSYNVLNAPRYNNLVFIQSRPASTGNFVTVGTSNVGVSQFIHANVNTDIVAREYRIAIVNRCGDTLYSLPHTLVLLNGQKTGPFSMAHTFSPYLGFPNGVNRYELYRSFTNGNDFQLYQTYSNPQSDNFDNGKDNYAQYFRIKAIESLTGTESWSNDILINYEPVLFIPNAFTPNQKGGNEVFIPFSGGLKTYKMSIYNRWGEKLFETANMTEGWDGTVLGDPVMQGIYVYVI
ncbi:MAG: gliding motility-associated C-terminal domain-containing protein, partial [Bacteroidota bacterium]